jgi:hypothetical protein
LLGQQHDRDIFLNYTDVKEYQFLGVENQLNWNDTFHGDILSHEVTMIDVDLFQHKFEMRSGSIFNVQFSRFEIKEKLHL